MTLSPIVLFTFNRLHETTQTIAAIQKNYLAKESDIFIFSDGPKSYIDIPKVDAVRKYLKTIGGFQSVTIIESPKNKGLANSIINGVSQIIKQYGKVIVLEDDIVTLPNFLDFMNQALSRFEKDNRIFSITGYSKDLPALSHYEKDIYLGLRASSWGWATWEKEWVSVDWYAKKWWQTLLNPIAHYKFTRGGSDMPLMLLKQMSGIIDSWAIRWCYSQFLKGQYTVIPSQSLILNIGFGIDATNTKRTKQLTTKSGDGLKREFNLDILIKEDSILLKEFRHKYSLISRIKDRLQSKNEKI